MGRHRRSAAGRAATGRATGVTETGPEPHYGPENLYGFAAFLEADAQAAARSAGSRRRKKKAVTPVKSGLLGVSAAVALGTVAVATGVLPGGDKYTVSGGASPQTVVPAGSPTGAAAQQGGTDGAADEREDESTSRDSQREASPPSNPSKTPTPPKTPSEEADKGSGSKKTKKPKPEPTKEKKTTSPAEISSETQAEAAVLLLVNEERAKAGCSPVAANSTLAKLAQAFSEDMALRDFFDHTDPDGLDPWDRAAALGIIGLGGENIARGQATAEAVMEAWMNSPGHRANILNCDFKTLGVGVHMADGGPWWTQDFGY